MTDEATKLKIRDILKAGHVAKAKLLQALLVRAGKGDRLSSTEIKTMRILEAELEQEMDSPRAPKFLGSFDEAAAYCGFSKQALSVHVSKGNIRQEPDGTFSREELDRFLESRGRKQGGAKSVKAARDAADLRWRLAKAKREELLVAQIKGGLISREEIAKEWRWRVSEIAAGLEMLTHRLPPRLEGKSQADMRHIIAEETDNLRRNYCRGGKYCPLTQEPEPKREKKAPAKKKPASGGRKRKPPGSRKSVSRSRSGRKNT